MRQNHSLNLREFIFSQPLNRMFSSRQLVSLAPRSIVDNTTSQLVKKGEIIRVGWGVFVIKGSRLPNDRAVANFKASSFGRLPGTHGTTVAEEHELPVKTEDILFDVEDTEPIAYPPICISSGTSSFRILTKKVPERKSMFNVCDRKLHLGDTPEGLLIRSLWQMGKDKFLVLPLETLKTLPDFEPTELVTKAAWMPYWISDRLHEIIDMEPARH